MDRILADSKIEYISMRPESTIKKPLVCRICMVEENLNSIFGNDNDSLAEKIRDCGKVEVTRNDGLPEFICTNCINKVDVCFELKLQIQASDTLLRKIYLGNYSSNNEKFSEEMGEPIEDSYYEDSVEQTNYYSNETKATIKQEVYPGVISDTQLADYDTDSNNKFDMTGIKRSKQNGRFCCPLCPLNFKAKKTLIRHNSVVHEQQRFYCQKCDSSYTTYQYLQLHLVEKHSEEALTYECDYCKKKFRLMKMLKGHMKNHLAKNRMLAGIEKNEPKRNSDVVRSVERRSHICHICGMAFKGQSRVLYHVKTVHAEKPQFECDLCTLAYKDKKGLVNHKRAVHENHRYECDQCNQASYRNKYMLTLHNLEKHSNLEPTVECKICKKLFKHDVFLKRHVRQTHNNKRRAVSDKVPQIAPPQKEIKYNYCTACDKNFPYRLLFSQHKAEHDGKFECRLCAKVFATDRQLTVHKTNKHDNPVVYCDKCEYQTTRHHQLARHIKFVHDGFRFECEFCDRRFAKKKTVDAHRLMHTEAGRERE